MLTTSVQPSAHLDRRMGEQLGRSLARVIGAALVADGIEHLLNPTSDKDVTAHKGLPFILGDREPPCVSCWRSRGAASRFALRPRHKGDGEGRTWRGPRATPPSECRSTSLLGSGDDTCSRGVGESSAPYGGSPPRRRGAPTGRVATARRRGPTAAQSPMLLTGSRAPPEQRSGGRPRSGGPLQLRAGRRPSSRGPGWWPQRRR